ncbi:MAG: putative multidrug efflux outer membrane protein family [Rhodospirillales bacterium]|jgi:multidrug efflux system outer membrane protein|nr:putative multidrug efflux outer membrane protein family [Rhodospirillales bacterium]
MSSAVMLAGCSVGPDYARPKTETPAAWRAAGQGPAVWPSPDWWRGFGSAELDQFIAEAEHNNYDLGAAIARVREADAQIRISGAALLPSVQASGLAERIRRPPITGASVQPSGTGFGSIGGASTGGTGSISNLYAVGLTASYEIDFWGKNHDVLASAQASDRASRFDEEVVYLSVVSNTAITYFAAVGLQDELVVARDNLKAGEDLLALLRGRLTAGTASALDVSQQETVVAGLRAQIPPLEQQLRQFVNALAILVGKLPEQVDVAPGTLTKVSVPAVAPGLPSELLFRRPDVQEAEAQLMAANANVKAARAAFFPSITLTAQGGFESVALGSLFNPTSALYSLAAGVTQPIFEGGLLEGTLEQQKARYDELEQVYRKSVVSAFSDVENALVGVQQTADQERLQNQAVTTARQSYDIALAQLRAGVVDLQTVLNTETALFQSETLLAQVRLTHIQAIVTLYQALGGGWQAVA